MIQIKTKYTQGDKDTALGLATKAYLDNFEYLKSPLKKSGQTDLVNETEIMMRMELRDMIRNDAPVSEVNQQVDAILKKMNTVATVVPEFGSIVTIALAIAIIDTIIVTSKKTRLSMISRK